MSVLSNEDRCGIPGWVTPSAPEAVGDAPELLGPTEGRVSFGGTTFGLTLAEMVRSGKSKVSYRRVSEDRHYSRRRAAPVGEGQED